MYNCMSVMVFRIVMKADETLKCVLVCCLQLAACKVSFPVTDSTWEFVTQVYYKICIVLLDVAFNT